MKEIDLSNGMTALIDDEDYDYLMQWKWYAYKNSYGSFRAMRANGKVGVYMHK